MKKLTGKRIGITTTVPVEIILAAGCTPVDLNNIFITSPESAGLVDKAEEIGYPRGICAWIKGIYASVVEKKPVDIVLIASQGDCSNTLSMMETFIEKNIETMSFEYPYSRKYDELKKSLEKLADDFGVTLDEAEKVRERLIPLRRKLKKLDDLTYIEKKVNAFENHLWLISSSDFNGDPDKFEKDLDEFLSQAEKRTPFKYKILLGYLGVPPIYSDIYDFFASKSAGIIFNEIQRQFSMQGEYNSLIEQYRDYTYPYDIFHRITKILPELEKREIKGIVHYVQSFCHRQIEDILIREKIKLPVLTIEGDRPGSLDERTKLRIESFLDIVT